MSKQKEGMSSWHLAANLEAERGAEGAGKIFLQAIIS
jgi:hypothetical protein